MPDLKEKNRIILKNSKMHELWDLGAPTILEQALQTIVAYVDTAMVGQIGAIASAAVGLTTTVNWLLNGILFAVSMGMLSFIAQYTGQGDLEAAHHTSAQAIWIIFVLGVIETVFFILYRKGEQTLWNALRSFRCSKTPPPTAPRSPSAAGQRTSATPSTSASSPCPTAAASRPCRSFWRPASWKTTMPSSTPACTAVCVLWAASC